jgi:hypothetical protein
MRAQLFCLLLSLSATLSAQDHASLRDQLIGAWRLVGVETIRPNGEVLYPIYGKHPEGLIVYDRSGWMSVQIASDPKAQVPATSSRQEFLQAPEKERAAAADAYYAYCGTFTVDSSAATVTHHIRLSLLPGERGEDGVRHVVIDGDRLILTAEFTEMGEARKRKLTWERIPPAAQ